MTLLENVPLSSPISKIGVRVYRTGQDIPIPDKYVHVYKIDENTYLLAYTFYMTDTKLNLNVRIEEKAFCITILQYFQNPIMPTACAVCLDGTICVNDINEWSIGKEYVIPWPPSNQPKALLKMGFNPPPNCVLPGTENVPEDMVSIIILTHNTLEITKNCVKSVLEKTLHPFELFVVDNASQDGTQAWFQTEPYLTLIANPTNISYSKANNLAIRRSRGKYVCLLNSDTIVLTRGWLQYMIKTAESASEIGTVGAKLLYPDGTIQHIGGAIHNISPYHPYDHAPSTIPEASQYREVPFNTGACLFIKRSTLEKIGLLDESYPFGYEDVDYGLKCLDAGLKNIICPEAELIHLWAYTQRKYTKWIPQESLRRFNTLWGPDKLLELSSKTNVVMDWDWPDAARWIRPKGVGSHIARQREAEKK